MSDVAVTALAKGRALLDVGRTEEAADAFRAAAAAEPEWPEPRCNLALALLRAGKPEDGLDNATAAAALDPESEWPQRLRAIAFTQLKRPRDAVAAAEEAARLAPEFSIVHEALADARRAARELRGARAAAEEARRLDPDASGPHATLGDICVDEERTWEAAQHYRAALAIDPEDAVVINNLGVAMQALGEEAEARELYERAARLDPRFEESRENLARTSRSFVNGTLVFLIGSFIGIRAAVYLFAAETLGGRVLAALVLVALVAFFVIRSRRRLATLSPGARQLLADQKWYERIEITRWRPWFWFIPSTAYFVVCGFATIAWVIGGLTGNAANWQADDFIVIGTAAVLTVIFGYFARLRRMRKGAWPYRVMRS